MENKFREGDRIRNIDTGQVGFVVDLPMEKKTYYVTYDDDGETYYAHEDKLECINTKEEFLEEFRNLLEKYNASIISYYDQDFCCYNTTITVGEDIIKYESTYMLDSENILEYVK